MIEFYTKCLDLIFVWFSSDSWLVLLPFSVMCFSMIIMLFYKLLRG